MQMCPVFILVSRHRVDFDRPEMQPHEKFEKEKQEARKKRCYAKMFIPYNVPFAVRITVSAEHWDEKNYIYLYSLHQFKIEV